MKKFFIVLVLCIVCSFSLFAEDSFVFCGAEYLHSNDTGFNAFGANVQGNLMYYPGHDAHPGFFFRGDFAIFFEQHRTYENDLYLSAGYGLAMGFSFSFDLEYNRTLAFSFGPALWEEGRSGKKTYESLGLFGDVCYILKGSEGLNLVIGVSCYAPLENADESMVDDVFSVMIPSVYVGFGL